MRSVLLMLTILAALALSALPGRAGSIGCTGCTDPLILPPTAFARPDPPTPGLWAWLFGHPDVIYFNLPNDPPNPGPAGPVRYYWQGEDSRRMAWILGGLSGGGSHTIHEGDVTHVTEIYKSKHSGPETSTETPAPIPLPWGAAMMLAALAALYGAGRRKSAIRKETT